MSLLKILRLKLRKLFVCCTRSQPLTCYPDSPTQCRLARLPCDLQLGRSGCGHGLEPHSSASQVAASLQTLCGKVDKMYHRAHKEERAVLNNVSANGMKGQCAVWRGATTKPLGVCHHFRGRGINPPVAVQDASPHQAVVRGKKETESL